MALLHDLIVLLDDAQLKRINALELPVRKQQVMEFVLSKRNSKLFPASSALKKLNITQTHLEKVCSVLMKKVIQTLAGDDPYKQFKFVRGLTGRPARLARHQMKVSEKLIKEKEQLITFYGECCESESRMDTTLMDSRRVSYYTHKLLSLIDPLVNPEKYIKIKCDELYFTIGQAVLDLGINVPTTRQKFATKIIKLDRQARELGHPIGRYQALRIAGMFFTSVDEQEIALKYFDENIIVTAEHEAMFTAREWMEPRLLRAESLSYMGRFREAYDIFCSLIRHSKYNIHNIRLSSQTRFFKVAVTLGEYTMAKEILDANFAVACQNEQPDLKVMAHLQYICYYMHIGDIDAAGKHLTTVRQVINRQRQQQYNIQLLFFENAYLYLMGEQGEAKIQVHKNLKFLRSKNINRSNSGYPTLFSVISYIYDYHTLGKAFTPKQKAEYDFCFRESFSHFGGVLKRILELKTKKHLSAQEHKVVSATSWI